MVSMCCDPLYRFCCRIILTLSPPVGVNPSSISSFTLFCNPSGELLLTILYLTIVVISMGPFLVSSILIYIDKTFISSTIGTTILLIQGMILGVMPIRSEDSSKFLLSTFPHTIMTSVIIHDLECYFS